MILAIFKILFVSNKFVGGISFDCELSVHLANFVGNFLSSFNVNKLFCLFEDFCNHVFANNNKIFVEITAFNQEH